MADEEFPSTAVYYAMKSGEIHGPFTRLDLRRAVEQETLAETDFVQVDGEAYWRPLSVVLNEFEGPFEGAVAPAWSDLLVWGWRRLRFQLDAQAGRSGVYCLLLGLALIFLSRWPALFWLPAFGAAALAARALLRRERWLAGALILAGAVFLPLGYFVLRPAAKVSLPLAEAEAVKAPLPAVAEAKPTPAPAPVVAMLPPVEATPVPARSEPPAATPVPAVEAVVTPAPALASSPKAPALALGDPLPPAPPAPLPILAHPSPPTIPGLPPPFSPSERVALGMPPPSSATPVIPGADIGSTLVGMYGGALALVEGAEGSGSSFIAKMGAETFLFTNAHVLAGIARPTFTRLDGTAIKPGVGGAAAGADIARFAVAEPPARPLEVIESFIGQVSLGDDVVVLGNSGGGGVVTSISGKLVGIGPDRIEVSAEFIPGNSGSPIIHVRTGKVIGVATYLTRRYDEFATPGGNGSQPPSPAQPGGTPGSGVAGGGTPGATPPGSRRGYPPGYPPGAYPPGWRGAPTPAPAPAFPAPGALVVRHFAYRLETVRLWEPIDWAQFRHEADEMQQISLLSGDIFDFIEALRKKQTPQFNTAALRRPATDWLTMVRGRHVSEADRRRATESFLRSLSNLARSDIAAADTHLRYWYFRQDLAKERKVRDALAKGFSAEAERLATPTNGSY